MRRPVACLLMLMGLLLCGCAEKAPDSGPIAAPAETEAPQSTHALPMHASPEPAAAQAGGETLLDPQNTDYAVLENRILSLYYHTEGAPEYYAGCLGELRQALPASVRLYAASVPTRIAFEDASIAAYSDDQQADIGAAYAALPQDVTAVDMFRWLGTWDGALDEIFFRLDHHWTSRGAYLGAAAFGEAAGVPVREIGAYTEQEAGTFYGYLYGIHGREEHRDKPDALRLYTLPGPGKTAVTYVPDETGALHPQQGLQIDPARGGYFTFVTQYCSYAVLEGAPESTRALLLIGDSSIYALAPWLADVFGTVVLIDLTYYDEGVAFTLSQIEAHGVTDALVCTSVNTALMFPYYAARIATLRLG